MDMDSFNNEFQGERIFLIGNGPSLNKTPLNKLEDEYTFGLNRVNSVYKKTNWRPDFYFNTWSPIDNIDIKFIKQNANLNIPCFINSQHKETFGVRDNIYYFNRRSILDIFDGKSIDDMKNTDIEDLKQYWSNDITEIIYTYHSMYAMIQIVTYMGFDEVYLVGVDLGFENDNPHMIFESGLNPINYTDDKSAKITYLFDGSKQKILIRSLINGLMFKFLTSYLGKHMRKLTNSVMSISDNNHFDSSYRMRPIDYSKADLEHIKSHILASRLVDENNISIYNATIGGELEVHPRVDLENVI
jgi:hypothetical protein